MTQADIIDLMKTTGQPIVVSGVRVKRWRWRHPSGWLQVGVYPTIDSDPSAYVGTIAGRKISGRAVVALMKARKIEMRRGWYVRTRCRLRS